MTFKMNNAPYPTNRKGKTNPNSEGNTDLKDGKSKSSTFQKNAPTKMGAMEVLMGARGGNPMMGMPAHNSSGSKSLQDDYIANKKPKPSGVKNYKKGYKTPGA
jgi:hypothetical protein